MHGARNPEAARDRAQIGRVGGQAGLAAGLAEALIVENQDRQILRALRADDAERANAHQHLAIPGQRQNAPLRTRQRQAERRRHRKPHAAP